MQMGINNNSSTAYTCAGASGNDGMVDLANFDIADLAFFGNNASNGALSAAYAGGYSFVYPAVPSDPFVSVGYIDVAGTVDTGTPAIAYTATRL